MPRVPNLLVVAVVLLCSLPVCGGRSAPAHPAGSAGGSPGASTQSAGVAVETLLEAVFPAERLPAGQATVSLARFALDAGAAVSWSAAPTPSVAVAYVEAGTYALRADGPLLVRRAGAAGPRGP